jgi:hypothetical protein
MDISFDGYCDGMHLNVPSVGVGSLGTLDGFGTGCTSDPLFGQASKKGFKKGTEYVTSGLSGLHYVIRASHKWEIYATDGSAVYLLNSGTWTKGLPPMDSARLQPSSVAKHAPEASMGTSSNPSKITDIILDGYCDGMHFNVPAAIGAPAIDGNRTGCASDPLYGTTGKVAGEGKKPGNVVSFLADGSFILQAGVFTNHTWVLYATDGTNEYLLNSGTWSPGTPTPGKSPLKASTSGL